MTDMTFNSALGGSAGSAGRQARRRCRRRFIMAAILLLVLKFIVRNPALYTARGCKWPPSATC